MAIQWFPGHMNKALKAIKARMKSIDAVIEIVDARAPGSSSGPLIDALAGSKPRIKLLNKKDLADPARVGAWVARFESEALLAGRSLTPDAVRDWVRDKLAHHSIPRDVNFVDFLPRNPTGKVMPRFLPESRRDN